MSHDEPVTFKLYNLELQQREFAPLVFPCGIIVDILLQRHLDHLFFSYKYNNMVHNISLFNHLVCNRNGSTLNLHLLSDCVTKGSNINTDVSLLHSADIITMYNQYLLHDDTQKQKTCLLSV